MWSHKACKNVPRKIQDDYFSRTRGLYTGYHIFSLMYSTVSSCKTSAVAISKKQRCSGEIKIDMSCLWDKWKFISHKKELRLNEITWKEKTPCHIFPKTLIIWTWKLYLWFSRKKNNYDLVYLKYLNVILKTSPE